MEPKKDSDIQRKNSRMLYTLAAFFAVILAIASMIYRYITYSSIESRSKDLQLINNYSFLGLLQNDTIKNEYPSWRSLSDIVRYDVWIKKEIEKSKNQREKLSLPYDNFLHFFYTPSLNIWKNPFSGDIDTSLVGEKYLLHNPYGDVELIQQRTNFFKDMGVVDQYNTIDDIALGSLEKVEGGFFALPITVQFETPDRRSFLLLVSKLSMTSYADNISLINEYMFYLRESIKKNKSDKIKELLQSPNLPSLIKTEDQLIGYTLYEWIKNDIPTLLIDSDVINEAISRSAGCLDQDSQECLYMFREKYRAVPYLAYGIAKPNGNIIDGLKQFFEHLPPLISIESFSFDQKSQRGKRTRDEGYKGSISIKVYGKDLGGNEVDEIANKLGGLCFQNKTTISPLYALSVINKFIKQVGQQDAINAKRSKQLNEMMVYIKNIDTEYTSLSNYKKVVRLFEIYRTLQEGNACDLITAATDINKDTIVSGLSVKQDLPIAIPVLNNTLLSGNGSDVLSGSLTSGAVLTGHQREVLKKH